MLEFLAGLLIGFLTCALLVAAFYFGGIYNQHQKTLARSPTWPYTVPSGGPVESYMQAEEDRRLKAERPTRHRVKSALGLTSLVEYPTCGSAR